MTEKKAPAYVVFFAEVGGCLILLVVTVSLVITTWMKSTKAPKVVSDPANSTDYTPFPPDSFQNNNAMMNQTLGCMSNLSKMSNSRVGPGKYQDLGHKYLIAS